MMKKWPLFAFAEKTKSGTLRKQCRICSVLWVALKRTCMALGVMLLISMVITALIAASVINKTAEPLPEQVVLVYNAKAALAENGRNENISQALMPARQTLQDLIDALDRARNDDRVKGFVTVLYQSSFDMVHAYELREAVKSFRESGKFAYIYAPSYGEMGRGLSIYYLASAFDKIWLQPIGTVSIAGIRMELPFARSLLDKMGIEPQFEARKEYKAVFENVTNKEMSPKNREAMDSLVTDLANHMTNEIAKDRNIGITKLKELVNIGVLLPEEALAAGLVDHIDYMDVLEGDISKNVTGVANSDADIFIGTDAYLNKINRQSVYAGIRKKPVKPKIGLVYINGTLVGNTQKSSSYYALIGTDVSSAVNIATAIRKAADDSDIDVIILRINSPGGTPGAAETIHRAVLQAQKKGHVIVVSMGGMAASAAYWIASPADRIFATPLTITGSIGVAGGKFSLQDMWKKIGINWDSVQWGTNADMLSMNEPFSEAGRKRFSLLIDRTYDNFVSRVAEGRKMSVESVEEVARGRPWTGSQASNLGLVDELGSFNDVLDYAAHLAGVDTHRDVTIEVFPKPKKPVEQILEFLKMQAGMGNSIDLNSYMDVGIKSRLVSILRSEFREFLSSVRAPELMSYELRQVVP